MCFASVKSRLVPAYPGSPGQRAVKRLCVCVNLSKLAEQQLFSVSSHNLCRSGLRVTVCLENLKYQGICQLSWDFRGKIFLLLITVYCFLQVTTSVCWCTACRRINRTIQPFSLVFKNLYKNFWSWTLYFVLYAFLHPIIIFSQHMPILSQSVLL